MTNNPEGKLGKRTVKNSFTNRMIENTCNTEENTKNISEMNNQNTMQIPVQNYQETQRNLPKIIIYSSSIKIKNKFIIFIMYF